MAEPRASTRARRLTDLLLCALTGVLTFGGFPTALSPDWTFFPLLWVSHVPLLWVLRDKSPRQAFRWGLLAGTFINAGGYYWLADLLKVYGHLPWPVAQLGLLLHSVYVGLMWGLWAWLMNRVGNTTRVPVTWTAPLCMVAVELVVPRIFPAYMGNSQYPWIAVMQICELTGIYGVTFLIYRVNATLYLWLRALVEGRQRPLKATLVTAGMMVAALIYGHVRIAQVDSAVAAAPKLPVGIVEGDVGIFETESRENQRNHLLIQQHLTAQLEQQGAKLVLWSESAYRMPFVPTHETTQIKPSPAPLPPVADWRKDRRPEVSEWDRTTPLRGFRVPVLVGMATSAPREKPRFPEDRSMEKYYNSALLLDALGRVYGRYDKNYLLVGGEYVPFVEYFPWIFKHIPALGDMEPGTDLKVLEGDLWGLGPVRIGVLICYEGILPAFARQLAEEKPHFLVNMTNDAWFGRTAERYLHLALTIPRAIEHRRAFARPTLTGVSAFVDPVGRLVSQTPVTGADTLLWDVPLLSLEPLYPRIGDVFAWLCTGFVLLAFVYGRLRRGV